MGKQQLIFIFSTDIGSMYASHIHIHLHAVPCVCLCVCTDTTIERIKLQLCPLLVVVSYKQGNARVGASKRREKRRDMSKSFATNEDICMPKRLTIRTTRFCHWRNIPIVDFLLKKEIDRIFLVLNLLPIRNRSVCRILK